MRIDVHGLDRLHIRVTAILGKFSEQGLPNAAARPAHEAIVDRRRRTIFERAVAPATAALEHVHDAADHPAIVRPLDAAHIRWQVGFDPPPLIVAQPKQIRVHDPYPTSNIRGLGRSKMSSLARRFQPTSANLKGVPTRHSAPPGRTTMKSASMQPTSDFQRESWTSMLLPMVMPSSRTMSTLLRSCGGP
jgi:hypothetical protein